MLSFLFYVFQMMQKGEEMFRFDNTWDEILLPEWNKEYYIQLRKFLIDEYKHYKIYPDMNCIFNALKSVSPEKVKVVILGQDPYHNPGQAHGYSFKMAEPATKVFAPAAAISAMLAVLTPPSTSMAM